MSEFQWYTYGSGDALPDAARQMMGDEADRIIQADDEDRDAFCLLVQRDGQWVGAMLMTVEPDERDVNGVTRVGSIRQLVVKPAARGQGLAGRLIRRAMQHARESEAERLRSTAGFGCPDHLAMYERLGFEQLNNTEQYPYLVSRKVNAAR